ncbi:hypothetical protein [Flavobacterium sp.]|uniref:hypothetical protein n=1 Tax=Flavobacterium sp. TaxID=239 RepID=UPI00286B20CC|nr:hypothetical protein [Flavobacterium sp.]
MKAIKRLQKTMILLVLAVILPIESNAMVTNTPTTPTNDKAISDESAARMINRLEEIKAMDRTSMNRETKRMLRKEVKSIKKELATAGRGVYLSVGAVIIIILLLILIL